MDKGVLQRYSTWAKENLENQIEVSLKALGINSENDIKSAKRVGDYTVIDGDSTSYPSDLYEKRKSIIDLVKSSGYRNVIEEFAYTWFNRFVALRFMEVHGFLPHGFRVLSNPAGGIEPEILKNLNLVKDELRLDMELCTELNRQGKIEELFRHVLIRQCNALSGILPMLFSADLGYLELLLPKNLLKGETVITKLNEISEDAFLDDVEIIGWMYQFYISSKKKEVDAAKKTITKDTLPAVTQLFTPDWIVRYMAQNSVGRLWLESYPDSPLRSDMKYYVEDAEQSEEVQRKIDEIKYCNVNPEEIRIIEPCCGSGHILVYVFDLLYKMYEEKGYQKRDIPTLILKNNLVGLDVDKRATQLASFSLIMKARSVNNRFFNEQYYVVPKVFEIKDSKLLKELEYRKHILNLEIIGEDEIKLIDYLVNVFEHGKTIGSLLKVEKIDYASLDSALDKLSNDAVSSVFNLDFLERGLNRLMELSNLAKVLSEKYDVMITNPPYIGSSVMENHVKEYAVKNYPNSKTDMFAMFMETGFSKINGFQAMINMQGWMSLTSYEDLRNYVLNNKTIVVLAHLGTHAFDSIPGEVVQTASFVFRNSPIVSINGIYIDLQEGQTEKEKEQEFFCQSNYYCTNQEQFSRIPGRPITAYWASEKMIECFGNSEKLSTVCQTRKGLATSDNNRFLRLWFEVSIDNTFWNCDSNEESKNSDKKWYPINKGGSHRKWYGNREYLINWKNDGYEIRNYRDEDGKLLSRPQNTHLNFKQALTWSKISSSDFSARMSEGHFMFDDAAAICHHENLTLLYYVLGFLNSSICPLVIKILNPTLNVQIGDVGNFPIKSIDNASILQIIEECINLAKDDWDSFETSWNFLKHPIVPSLEEKKEAMDSQFKSMRIEKMGLISWNYDRWSEKCQLRFDKLKEYEEELNRFYIGIYGLQEEISPVVKNKDISIRLANKEKDIKSLISYFVGIAMGRYSIDLPGLTYAGGDWDSSKYMTYQPDDDGIIPIYNGIGMEDGLTTVLIKLIKLIYGEETYRQNIDFIAEALGKKNNESSEETLNRYLNDGFYKDHLKTYQKRPIYWLFSSGDNSGFKCLIYMHRYNQDTLARINGKYFLPESTRKKNELEELNGKIAHAEGRDKVRLEKERQNLFAAYSEAVEYGQVLDHMANKYISIDLDDGVKVNYAKFQEVEIVTDNGTKVKKDLLAPLK